MKAYVTDGACSASRALKAFSWLNFFICICIQFQHSHHHTNNTCAVVFGYMTALIACAVVSVRRGTGKFLSMDVDQILSPHDATPVELQVETAQKV
jgi:hypothetical protein